MALHSEAHIERIVYTFFCNALVQVAQTFLRWVHLKLIFHHQAHDDLRTKVHSV